MGVEVRGLHLGVTAVIPAAGLGRRMQGKMAKQFLLLRGEPILVRTVRTFSECPLVDEIVVVAHDIDTTRDLVGALPKVTRVVQGGAERQDSVQAALGEICARPRILCIHDAVRPLLRRDLLEAVLCQATWHKAQVVAVPVKDTIKVVTSGGYVSSTLDRSTLWAVQTPQVFWMETLVQALRKARADGFVGTDCASAVERLQIPVHVHLGSPENIKITTPEDLALAEIIAKRHDDETFNR